MSWCLEEEENDGRRSPADGKIDIKAPSP